jgi:transcription factor C subunit 6
MVRPALRKRQRTTYTAEPLKGHDALEDDASSARNSDPLECDETEDEYRGIPVLSTDGESDSEEDSYLERSRDSENSEYRADGGSEQGSGTRSRRRRVHPLQDENQPAESPEAAYKARPKNVRHHDRVNYSHVGKRDRLAGHFGRDTEDLINAIRCRDKWCNNPTLPTRCADERGSGGLAYSFFYSQEQREYETTSGWAWYIEDGGWNRFRKRQRTTDLTDNEGSSYLPQPETESYKVLLGPRDAQRLVLVGTGGVIGLRDIWIEVGSSALKPAPQKDKTQDGQRGGWIFNIAAKVLCMDWLPNRPHGK